MAMNSKIKYGWLSPEGRFYGQKEPNEIHEEIAFRDILKKNAVEEISKSGCSTAREFLLKKGFVLIMKNYHYRKGNNDDTPFEYIAWYKLTMEQKHYLKDGIEDNIISAHNIFIK